MTRLLQLPLALVRWFVDVLSFAIALAWLVCVRRVYQPVYILALWFRIRAVRGGKAVSAE